MNKQPNNRMGYRIITEINRCSQEVIEKLKKYDTTLLADGANTKVAMEHCIKPIIEGSRFVGPAITIKLTLGDSLLVSKALDLAQAGDVIVVDGFGTDSNALWGDLKSLISKSKNLAGAVIDGAIRDKTNCQEIGFPIFCKYTVCSSSTKNSPGEINVPVTCGKMTVMPGDIIVADDNGIVVLPPDRLNEIMENAEKKHQNVEKIKKEILEGKYITDGFSKKMQELGYDM